MTLTAFDVGPLAYVFYGILADYPNGLHCTEAGRVARERGSIKPGRHDGQPRMLTSSECGEAMRELEKAGVAVHLGVGRYKRVDRD